MQWRRAFARPSLVFHAIFSVRRAGSLLSALVVLCLLSGCTPSHYRKRADKDVYRIIEQVEGKIFGHTNSFTIDTPYAVRKPAEIFAPELIEDRLQAGQRLLTIEEALALSATQSRRYQDAKEQLYLTALTLTGARHRFTPQFFAGTGGRWTRDADGAQSDAINTSVGVNQLLKSGGSLGVTLANDLLNYYTGDPGRSVINSISVNLAQPLLRGFGRNSAAVESLKQAERNVVYAVRDYSFFQNDFALEIVNDYFALLERKDVIRNRYANYLSRGQSALRLEARGKDRERLSDVDQARQAELTARNNYVDALASFQTALDQYKIKLGLPLGEKIYLDDSALAEVKRVGLIPVQLLPEDGYRLAVRSQLPILNDIDRFEDSKRQVRLAADGFKPDLLILADASLRSDPYPDYATFDPDKIRGGVGLELDLPLDRLRERNDYRATLVSFESDLRGLTLTLDTLRDDIERGLRTLEQRRQNHQIQTNAVALANRRVASTTLFVQAGLNPVRDLLEAQDAQIAAQNAVTAAIIDHQEARLQLMLDLGALDTSEPKFWLKDHLADFVPESAPSHGLPSDVERPVIPPEQFFNQ